MSAKQIDVTCPCCSTRLTVDVLTAQVLRRSPPAEAPDRESAGAPAADRWASAQERVRDRSKSGEDRLESALEQERGKSKRFDDLFEKAREKHVKKPGEDSP
jgi:hypothetical protein